MVKFTDVSKVYDEWIALSGINLQIADEEFLFLVGPSGAGKTTLMKLIYMQDMPTSGEVKVMGYSSLTMDRKTVPKLRRNLGYVFQDFKLLPDLNVEKQIEFVLTVTGHTRKTVKERTFQVLSDVGLVHKAKSMPNELSGGEAQRVAIARAMANYPKLILADEPTGNLDPGATEDVMNLLLAINRQGTGVIMATHDIDIVEEMRKRTIEIANGVIVGERR